jgi:hypothetical protein
MANLLFEAQTTLQREINPKAFSTADWQAKLAANASFVLDVLAKWLHRLASEPRRLWRRYLVTNSLFVWGAVRQLLTHRRVG